MVEWVEGERKARREVSGVVVEGVKLLLVVGREFEE